MFSSSHYLYWTRTACCCPQRPNESVHDHPPNRVECEKEILKATLKRKAVDHPEQPPTQMLRTELRGLSDTVLAQIPERENLKKTIRRERRKHLPANPLSLNDLGDLPDRYQRTLIQEKFLIGDWKQNDKRVLVFATRRNLELLAQSSIWFVDGTFKVCPTIFTQVVTILGLIKRNRRILDDGHISEDETAVPLAYALLSSKEQIQYEQVFRMIVSTAQEYRINDCKPEKILSDFEKAIINACEEVFPDLPITCCFYHLGQSVYRNIQEEGLATLYNAENGELRVFTHMMLALAYVPVEDVQQRFQELKQAAPIDLQPILNYFEKNYVIGRPARGRRPAVLPRYPVWLWNQNEAARFGYHKTNNISEGWHNRFRIVVGKHHPDLYSALTEFQKEQTDTEIILAEWALGRKVKAAPKKKWLELQSRLRTITLNYENYVNDGRVLDFLRAIAHNVILM